MSNKKKVYSCIGANNHSKHERANEDYYATDPKAIDLLFAEEQFDNNIWECACGEGHLSKRMIENKKMVYSTDLIDRGFGFPNINFLEQTMLFNGDIITNPPYKLALEFVLKALELINDGNKVAMFLKLTFLESKKRKELFLKTPPKTLYVSSDRLSCYRNGDPNGHSRSAVAYGWYVWEKGFNGNTQIKWIN